MVFIFDDNPYNKYFFELFIIIKIIIKNNFDKNGNR